jgi:hypothetical protein
MPLAYPCAGIDAHANNAWVRCYCSDCCLKSPELACFTLENWVEEHGGHGIIAAEQVDALVQQLVMAGDKGWMEEVGQEERGAANSGR